MDNRVWASGAAASPPTAPASPSVGYPSPGDPLTATPATKGGAFWFHQIGEELRAVLTASEITPSTANNAQLLEAIRHQIDARSGVKNILINPGFTINQRAYISGAALAAGAYGHDRWKAGAGGGDYTFTQLASNTQITIAANKTLIQVIEDKNIQGTSYVLSWTGTALARYAVNSAIPAGAYAASPILITGQTAGSTMSIEFGNGVSTGTLGEVQLVSGGIVTAFENRSYGAELALCYRYCYAFPINHIFGVALNTTNLTAYIGVGFKQPMRAAPTIVSGTYTASVGAAGTVSGQGATADSMSFYNQSATWTAGAIISVATPIVLSAEL